MTPHPSGLFSFETGKNFPKVWINLKLSLSAILSIMALFFKRSMICLCNVPVDSKFKNI